MYIKMGELLEKGLNGDCEKIGEEFWKKWEGMYGIPEEGTAGWDRSYFYFWKRAEVSND